jgi:hypothetical protein
MALRINSKSVLGRPRRLAAGSKGSRSSHWSTVRLLGYDLLIALWGLLFRDNSLYPKSFSSDTMFSQTPSKSAGYIDVKGRPVKGGKALRPALNLLLAKVFVLFDDI